MGRHVAILSGQDQDNAQEFIAMTKPVCAVVGVGPGNGAALARRFSAGGYAIALIGRTREKLEAVAGSVDDARVFVCDAADADAVRDAFSTVRQSMGVTSVLCYNAGSGSWSNPEQTTPQAMLAAYGTNVLGLLTASQQVVPDMLRTGGGAILVSGATASLRGGAITTAFAAGKAAQRSLAQSLARHLGPKGIHVAHFIIDGVIDLLATRSRMADKPEDFFLKPDDIADTMFHVAAQPQSAWTFEVDLRPYGERW
jgi:NADP-dependent 3-hydroxy acid dehydrogenase YdfG